MVATGPASLFEARLHCWPACGLYPTGIRIYARVIPSDEHLGEAAAILASRVDASKVFLVATDATGYPECLHLGFVARAAGKMGSPPR